jgi:serine/threonine protein phosphatase PrpC
MAPTWTALSASVRGATHERDGRGNQDAVALRLSRSNFDPLFVAVADGHGSARSFRSDRGSRFAVACARESFLDLLRRHRPGASFSRLRRQFQRRWTSAVLARWRAMVRADIEKEPFSPFEFAPFPEAPPRIVPGRELPFHAYLAYGATLVVAAIARGCVFYAQLGDGDILIVSEDGQVTRPWPRDHAFFANVTVSMCSPDAADHFHGKVSALRAGSAPALILLATDGYANCFTDDDGFFQVGADFLDYLREAGPAFVQEKLGPWLRESSRDGSGDDITVGLALRLSALRVPALDAEPAAP